MSRFVGFGDKSWDNLKNFFQTQGFEFLFLSQSARRVALRRLDWRRKRPFLKLNRRFCPQAAQLQLASELIAGGLQRHLQNPQVAGLLRIRDRQSE